MTWECAKLQGNLFRIEGKIDENYAVRGHRFYTLATIILVIL